MAMATAFGKGDRALRALWENRSPQTNADVTIVCAGDSTYCHSKPLKEASPKFKVLLELCPGVLNLGIKPIEALFVLKVVYGLTFTFPSAFMPSLVSLLNRYEIPHPPLHVSDGPMVSPEIGTSPALSRIAQLINTAQENRRNLEIELRTTLRLVQAETVEPNKSQNGSKSCSSFVQVKRKKTVDSGTQTVDSELNVLSMRSIIHPKGTFGTVEAITERYSCETAVITKRNLVWGEDTISQVPKKLYTKQLSHPNHKIPVENAPNFKSQLNKYLNVEDLCFEEALKMNIPDKQPDRNDVKLSVIDKLLQGTVTRKVSGTPPKGTMLRREDKDKDKRLLTDLKEICKSNAPLVREGMHQLRPIASRNNNTRCIWCPRPNLVPDDSWKWKAALEAGICYKCVNLCGSYSCFHGEQCSLKSSRCDCRSSKSHSSNDDGSSDPGVALGNPLEGNTPLDSDHLGMDRHLEDTLVNPAPWGDIKHNEPIKNNTKSSRSQSLMKDIKDVESFVVGGNEQRYCGNPVSRPLGLTLPASTELVEGIRTIYQPASRDSRILEGKIKDPMIFCDVNQFFYRLQHEAWRTGKAQASEELCTDRPIEDLGCETEPDCSVSVKSESSYKKALESIHEDTSAFESWRKETCLDWETAEGNLSVPGYTESIHLGDLQMYNEWEVAGNCMVKSLMEDE